jgi:hypothetical protein
MRRIARPGLAHKGRRVSRCCARVAGSASAVSGEQGKKGSSEVGSVLVVGHGMGLEHAVMVEYSNRETELSRSEGVSWSTTRPIGA